MSSHISDFGSPLSGVMPPPVTPKDMVSRKLRFDAESRRASSTPTPKQPLVSFALRSIDDLRNESDVIRKIYRCKLQIVSKGRSMYMLMVSCSYCVCMLTMEWELMTCGCVIYM